MGSDVILTEIDRRALGLRYVQEIYIHLIRAEKYNSICLQSEERGKDDKKQATLRPAGSSPCVVVEAPFSLRDQVADPEQGIYHGFYRLGMWICITDRDVWKRHELVLHEGDLLNANACESHRFLLSSNTNYENIVLQTVFETFLIVGHQLNRRKISGRNTKRSRIVWCIENRVWKCTDGKRAIHLVSA